MGSLIVDVKHALRTLARTPAFTLVMIAMLSLGVGATTATFTLVDAVLLRPLPYRDADRLLLVFEGIPRAELPRLPFSAPDLRDFERMQRAFSMLAAFRNREFELSGAVEPERIAGARVSATLFDTLGVQPALGRFFLPAEDAPGQHVAVLSHGFWQRRFGGDPAILGRTIPLDRQVYSVIGVAPASFTFPHPGLKFGEFVKPAVLFVPMAFTPVELESRGMMFQNMVVGRLAPGATLDTARAEVDLLAGRIQNNYPAVLRDGPYRLVLSVTPLREAVTGAVERPLLVMLGAVGLVLLVTCANAASLSLTRAASRRQELAVRAALGAGRVRLAQVLLAESLIVAAASGVTGLVLSRWWVQAARAWAPEALPLTDEFSLNLTVVAFALVVTLLTTALFGLAPLLGGERIDAESALREGASRTTAGPSRLRLQGALVAATAALAVVLLVGAGLLVRSFARLVRTDPGFRPAHVVTLSLTLPNDAYREPAAAKSFVRTMQERIARLPGVRAASLSTAVPTFFSEQRAFTPETRTPAAAPESVTATWTLGRYFEVMGIPLLRGRVVGDADGPGGQLVAVVSASLARRHWPGADAVGKRLKWGVAQSSAPWMTIVGVVGDVNDGPLGSRPRPHVYVPYLQMADDELDEVARAGSSFGRAFVASLSSEREPGELARSAIAEIHNLDAALAVAGVTTMEERLAAGVAAQRFSMALLAAFALAALSLAAVGLYGVLALGVAQRVREIGVRMALGASRGDVARLVVRQGMRLVVAGLCVGLAGAAAFSRVLSSALYETTTHDPLAFFIAPAVLAVTALLSSYLPARRAARVDPVVALRIQ